MTKSESACNKLKGRILSGAWNIGESLPALEVLAAEYAVSRMTVSRIIRKLVLESLVHIRGKRIVCGATGSSGPVSIRREQAWERVKTRLGCDIHSHLFADGSLPASSKLALRYGCAVNTLTKALSQLVSDGLLVRTGRMYRQYRDSSGQYQPSVVLIAHGDAVNGVISSNPRAEQIVRGFERECQNNNLSARLEGFDFYDPSASLVLSRAINKMKNVDGFVLNLWAVRDQTHWQRWIDLIQFLLDRNTPVIAVDQEGTLAFPLQILQKSNFRVLRIGGARAGAMMAETLLKRGYVNAAFLAHDPDAMWARDRFNGFKKHFESYGGPDVRVDFHSLTTPVHGEDQVIAATGADFEKIKVLFGKQFSRERMDYLAAVMGTPVWKKIEAALPRDKTMAALRAFTHFVADPLRQNIDPQIFGILYDALWGMATTEAMQVRRKLIFKNISTAGTADVWICSDDQTAYSAISFLGDIGKNIPRDISVVGFDDWRESLGQGLTTYNFNMLGIVQQALQMILDRNFLKIKPVISEVDGYVVERRTTRR
jgi:DNA-binding LacI/PurR family transcriptional regulator/DNA-binding transcriptional regulator YhcF (GntR family)